MPSDHDDDVLLDRLRRLCADVDPTPARVRAAAEAAIEARDLDARLAELILDSWSPLAGVGPQRVRDATAETPGERVLAYEGAGVRVDIAVQPESDSVAVIGRITGAAAEGCVLERVRGGSTVVAPDELGRFLLTGLPHGPVRMRCRSAQGASVVTAWLNV